MDKILTVTWRHTEDQKEPCLRCTDTGRSFSELLEVLLPVFTEERIILDFRDDCLPPAPGQSENILFFNGIPVSTLLSYAARGEEYCHASRCSLPDHIHRRFLDASGVMCDEAPEILVRKAILLAVYEELQFGFSDL